MCIVMRALRPIAECGSAAAICRGGVRSLLAFTLLGLVLADVVAGAWQTISTGTFVSEANARRGERRNRQRSDLPSTGFDESASRQSSSRDSSSSSSSSPSPSSSSSASSTSSTQARGERGNKSAKNDSDDRADAADRQNENSGRDGGRDERRQQGRERGAGDRLQRQPEGRPPATLAEAFDRLFSAPAEKAATAPAAVVAARTAAAAEAPAAAVAGATVGHRPADTVGRAHTIDQVLARNPTPSGIEAARRMGFKVTQERPAKGQSEGVVRLVPPAGMSSVAAMERLKPHLGTQTVHHNWIYRIYRQARHGDAPQAQRIQPARGVGTAVPCQGDRCFGRRMIGWHAPLETCAAGLRVGIIDTGVDLRHPAFAGHRVRPESFLPPDRTPAPNWHGTAVLALLAAHGQSGTPGLIPQTEFFAANVFFKESDGGFATDTASLVRALRWMADNKVQIVNMSFAGPRDALVQEWIEKLSARGMVFVAAAGNEGPNAAPSFPAAYPQVIAVTAVNREGRSFSAASRGDHIDIAAPGVDIWTAVPGEKEGYYSGTSFAAPFATAVVAAAYRDSRRKDKEALLARLQIQDLGAAGRDAIYGRGMVAAPASCNAPAAAAAAPAQPAPAPSAPVVRAAWPSGGPSGVGGPAAAPR
jgi:hypothetical protein